MSLNGFSKRLDLVAGQRAVDTTIADAFWQSIPDEDLIVLCDIDPDGPLTPEQREVWDRWREGIFRFTDCF